MSESYKPAWDEMLEAAHRSNNYIDRDQGIIWAGERIAELEAKAVNLVATIVRQDKRIDQALEVIGQAESILTGADQ